MVPFTIPAELTVFQDFYLPGRLYMEAQYLNTPARAVYERVARYYGGGGGARGRRLYLSRRGVDNRRLVNEEEVETLLAARGFEIVRPETLSFAEQARLFSQASHLAGPVGTALHNSVFSLEPLKLKALTMIPEGLVTAGIFYQLESSFGRRPEVVFGRYLDPDVPKDIRLTFYGPWTLDLDELKAALDQWLEGD